MVGGAGAMVYLDGIWVGGYPGGIRGYGAGLR